LVQPESVEELRNAMATLLDDADLRRRLGRAGRERMQKEFSIATMASQHVDLYESVIDA